MEPRCFIPIKGTVIQTLLINILDSVILILSQDVPADQSRDTLWSTSDLALDRWPQW